MFRHEGLVVILETLVCTWGVIAPHIVQPQDVHRDNILASGCPNEQISISYDTYFQQEEQKLNKFVCLIFDSNFYNLSNLGFLINFTAIAAVRFFSIFAIYLI